MPVYLFDSSSLLHQHHASLLVSDASVMMNIQRPISELPSYGRPSGCDNSAAVGVFSREAAMPDNQNYAVQCPASRGRCAGGRNANLLIASQWIVDMSATTILVITIHISGSYILCAKLHRKKGEEGWETTLEGKKTVTLRFKRALRENEKLSLKSVWVDEKKK